LNWLLSWKFIHVIDFDYFAILADCKYECFAILPYSNCVLEMRDFKTSLDKIHSIGWFLTFYCLLLPHFETDLLFVFF
jgi:hypothetical protein